MDCIERRRGIKRARQQLREEIAAITKHLPKEAHHRSKTETPATPKLPEEYVTQTALTTHDSHLEQIFLSMKLVRELGRVDPDQLFEKTVKLPRRQEHADKKTVIFDLDETLIHCNREARNGDVLLPIELPTGQTIIAGINVRPFARECLAYAAQRFEVIVFTASHQSYADAVLDFLDPKREMIHHRLYRDSCIKTNGVFIKDLRILRDRRIEDMTIIDNCAHSFAYQLDCGIPIISWYNDRDDRELFNLMSYLKVLETMPDSRAINRHTFKLHSLYEDFKHRFESDCN